MKSQFPNVTRRTERNVHYRRVDMRTACAKLNVPVMTLGSARFMSDNCAYADVYLYASNVSPYFGLKYTEQNRYLYATRVFCYRENAYERVVNFDNSNRMIHFESRPRTHFRLNSNSNSICFASFDNIGSVNARLKYARSNFTS